MGRLVVATLLVVWTGCAIKDSLVRCDDGRACPIETVCDLAHHSCVAPEQLTACVGLAEGADCVAGAVVGGCFDGVCIRRGCGNAIVEDGEQCDDGNQSAMDGCSGDCLSNETCRNGVVDPGEECDDGNALSRDGCDSSCFDESVVWDALPVLPLGYFGSATLGAFDPSRGRDVLLTSAFTWEWDGTAWTGTRTPTGWRPQAVYYDPDRGALQALASLYPSAFPTLWEWTSTGWVARTTVSPPMIDSAQWAAYDPSRHQAVIVGSLYYLQQKSFVLHQDGTWATVAVPGTFGQIARHGMAYDPETQTIILINGPNQWTFNGTSWSQSTPSQLPGTKGALVYHAGRGHLWLLGGASGTTRSANVYEKVSGTWTLVPSAALPYGIEDVAAEYDAQRNVMLAAVGVSYPQRLPGEVIEWSSGTWTAHVPLAPPQDNPAIAGDLRTGRVMLFGGNSPRITYSNETWIWDGTWQRAMPPASPPGRFGAVAAYDPMRGAVVMYGGYDANGLAKDTWSFDGTTWTSIDLTGPMIFGQPDAMAYDPNNQRMLLEANYQLWSLPSNASSWTLVGPTDYDPTGKRTHSLAWSPRDSTLLALTEQGYVYEMTKDNTWTRSLAPGDGYELLLTDERAGVVEAIPSTALPIWEWSAGAWTSVGLLPTPALSLVGTSDGAGRLVMFGTCADSLCMSVRTRTNARPVDSCASDDLDGDGLISCADPDCWATCSRCPPFATCP